MPAHFPAETGERPLAVVIPVKSPSLAKSRLGLPDDARADVALRMMRHVVSTAVLSAQVERVVVVSGDAEVGAIAESLGASWLSEPDPGGLNLAVAAGVGSVPEHDVVVMVSDLPWLTSADLEAAIAEFRVGPGPVVVADHVGTGTTLLARRPDDDLPFLFGPDSAARHVAAGYRPAAGPLPGLRHDLDTAADLAALTGLA